MSYDAQEKQVKVSVIVPVYNVHPYINEAVDSVIHQSYKNLEIILIDDGSTDGSGEICDQYASIDSRVRIIHQVNQGLSAARNAGLDCMTGDVVAFLDPDDVYYPQMIQKMVGTMIHEQVDCVICRYIFCRTEKKMRPQKWNVHRSSIFSLSEPGMYTMKEALAQIVENRINCNVWNKIYRKELWKELRYPVGQVYEDLDIILPLISLAENVFILEDVLVVHRYRRGSISNTITLQNKKDAYTALQHSESFIATQIPELFTIEQLQGFHQRILKFLLDSYAHYYYYNQSDRANVESWLVQEITKQKQIIDIKQCTMVTRAAEVMYRIFPQILKIICPLYRMIRLLI